MAMMTKDWLAQHCRKRGLYQTPYLNDRLYLQCQALCDLQNLEEYTGVKMLYLEENCLESLRGLQPLKQLQCLYLRRNYIRSLDYLEELQFLDTLDISQNCIKTVDNLSKCMNLRVLVISHNLLGTTESIEHLASCPSLMILDLAHNELKDGEGTLEIVKKLPRLAVLYMTGNPCVARIPHYRKTIVGKLGTLSHLDDRPVFWDERLYAEAWLRGGQDAETAERDRVRKMRADEETRQFESMRSIRERNMAERSEVVVPPTMLQFDPSELGEDVEPMEEDAEVLKLVEVTLIYNNTITGAKAQEDVAIKVKLHPSRRMREVDCTMTASGDTAASDYKPSSKEADSMDEIRLSAEEPTSGSDHEIEQKLERNPIYDARDSRNEQHMEWPSANTSMLSDEFQSICLPQWVATDNDIDLYTNVCTNELLLERTPEESCTDAQRDESTTHTWTPLDHELQRPKSPTFNEHGRTALASLTLSDLEEKNSQKAVSSMREEDNSLVCCRQCTM